ncbi:MAG TPA: tricarballylate utilization 4Fe-4S protein TcuB [Thermodesulfobacteriota bacterium]
MPGLEVLREAERQMVICNACRYCEGFCAVFPAMERRRVFTAADVTYLANLCFDCRACYYACQYAPPHEFAINVPQILSALRTETYRDYTWPGIFGRFYRQSARSGLVVSLIAIAIVFLLTLAWQGPEVLFSIHRGEGAFYRVVPYLAMVLPALAITLYGVGALAVGTVRFWRDTRGSLRQVISPSAFWKAVEDAFSLRYLDGGGDGCNYPDERFSQSRRWHHHLVFYGFLLAFASTTTAAIYDHFLHWQAPYPFFSVPVLLGTSGGIMMVIGTTGLLWLKAKADRAPAERRMLGMDVAFLVILNLTNVTGLALLAFRETAAMGTLLTIHLGFVAAFFVTAPYGKFAHVWYRYAALVRNAIERDRPAVGGH